MWQWIMTFKKLSYTFTLSQNRMGNSAEKKVGRRKGEQGSHHNHIVSISRHKIKKKS